MKNMRIGLKETYDNLDEASVGSRLLLFGILYNLFLEFASYPVLEQKYVNHGPQQLVINRSL